MSDELRTMHFTCTKEEIELFGKARMVIGNPSNWRETFVDFAKRIIAEFEGTDKESTLPTFDFKKRLEDSIKEGKLPMRKKVLPQTPTPKNQTNKEKN